MSEPTEPFDDLYRRWRDPLYRVVVLATDDRDLALAAVDGGFGAMRADPRRPSQSAAEVLRRAIAASRKVRSDSIRGFRLPDALTGPGVAAATMSLRKLDLVDRFVVLGRIYLDFDDGQVAHATGIAVDDIQARFDGAVRQMTSTGSFDTRPSDDEAADGDPSAEAALAGALVAAGDGISRPLSRLESVKTDARSRRAIQVAAAVAVVGALALGVAAVVSQLGDDPPAIVAEGDPSPDVSGSDVDPTTGPTTAIPMDEIEWVETGLPFREGELTALTAGPNGFVAIASDWSDPSGQGLRLLESESGFEWTILDAPLSTRSGYISELRYADGQFIAVGNAFNEQTGADTPMMVIGEENGEWRSVEIATENTIEMEGMSIDVSANLTSVAVSGDGITAFGTLYAQQDVWPLIEDALPEGIDGNSGYGTSPEGIEIYNARGDVVYTATAEELGIPADVFALVGSGLPSIWRSTDGGETWDQERLSGTFGMDTYLAQMATDGDTMLAVVQSGMGGALWSWDGEEWERVNLGDGVSPTSVVRFGERFFVAGVSGTGGGMWSSNDGVAWEPIGGEVFAGMQPDRISGSEYGIVAVGQERRGGVGLGPAVLEEDGLTLTMDTTGRYVVTDAAGAELLDVFAEDLVTNTGSKVSFVDPDTGSVILTVDQRDIDQAWEAVFREVELGGPPGAAPAIVVSRNGVDWVRLDAEPLGGGFYPSSVALGPEAILLSGYRESGGEAGPALWVGELVEDAEG